MNVEVHYRKMRNDQYLAIDVLQAVAANVVDDTLVISEDVGYLTYYPLVNVVKWTVRP